MIVGHVVKLCESHERGSRVNRSRTYATGFVDGESFSVAWTTMRRRAYVFKGIDLAPSAGKAQAETLRDALVRHGHVPVGKRAIVVRVSRVRRMPLRIFQVIDETADIVEHYVARNEEDAHELFESDFVAESYETTITRLGDAQVMTFREPGNDDVTSTRTCREWCRIHERGRIPS